MLRHLNIFLCGLMHIITCVFILEPLQLSASDAPTWLVTGSSEKSGNCVPFGGTFELEISQGSWLLNLRVKANDTEHTSSFRFDGTNIYVLAPGVHGESTFGITKGKWDSAAAIYPFECPLGGQGLPQAIWIGLICQIDTNLTPRKLPNLFNAEFSKREAYAEIKKELGFPAAGTQAEIFDRRLNGQQFVRERIRINKSTNFDEVTVPLDFSRSLYNPESDKDKPVQTVRTVVKSINVANRPLTFPQITTSTYIVDYRFAELRQPIQYVFTSWPSTNQLLSNSEIADAIRLANFKLAPPSKWTLRSQMLTVIWLSISAACVYWIYTKRQRTHADQTH